MSTTRIAVLGAGHAGPVIARLASEAVADADLVILAIPLHRITDLDPASLAGATVVKALNHIGYHDLEDQTRPAHAPDRRAAGVAGDDPAAVDAIAAFVDRLGYDPVRLDSLRAGRILQPGGPVFGVTLTRPEFEQAIREEARSLTP